jgi:acyl carrier protein
LAPGFPADPRISEILDIVAKETDVERAALVPDATLDELGIPSLDLTHALFAIETHFDIEIPVVADQQGAEFTTVGALVAHILATLERLPAASPVSPPGSL